MAQRVVDADMLAISISFWEEGEDLLDINKKMKSNFKEVKTFLTGLGFKEEEIKVQPNTIIEKTKNHFDEDGKTKIQKDYTRVESVLEVNTSKLGIGDSVSEKAMSLGDCGIKYRLNMSYILSDLDALRPQMLSEALVSAKNAANEFAKTSGATLGKIKNADQGRFTITSPTASNEYDSAEPFSKQKKVRVISRVTFSLDG